MSTWLMCALALASPASRVAADPGTDPLAAIGFQHDNRWALRLVEELVHLRVLDESDLERADEAWLYGPITRYEFACAWAPVASMVAPDVAPHNTTRLILDAPEDHPARPAIVALCARGWIATSAFRDVDAFHWAAWAVARMCPASTGQQYLVYRGDQRLLRREYAVMAYHGYCAAVMGGCIADEPPALLEHGPLEFVVASGILVGEERTHDLRLARAMSRYEFALATLRFLELCGVAEKGD